MRRLGLPVKAFFPIVQCLRCRRKFQTPLPLNPKVPQYCRDCFKLLSALSAVEQNLIKAEFSLDQEDEDIAKQMQAALLRERSGVTAQDEQLLNELTAKLIADTKKRKKIVNLIRKVQRRKR